MDIEQIYKKTGALLEGHFLLSSGKHSKYYLQSAKVLQDPKTASIMATELSDMIIKTNIQIDTICSPAIGGLIAGYELARALGCRFIFTERVDKIMTLRRGFEVYQDEKILICEDIITTGGSALEASNVVENLGANVVAYAALANRGICSRTKSNDKIKKECKLPKEIPFFALENFDFKAYEPKECPLCQNGTKAHKPGSRGN